MKKIGLAVVLGVAVIALGASNGFSQIPAAPDRIIQPVVINGQQVNAAYVTAPGGRDTKLHMFCSTTVRDSRRRRTRLGLL